MPDYTKFRIKKEDEIKEILKDTSSIFIIFCQKCYKEFEAIEGSEYKNIIRDIDEKRVLGEDFLCNHYLTEKRLRGLSLDDIEVVGVISCGIGIQYIAQLLEGKKRVVSLADSIPQSRNATSILGYHGVALGLEKCACCGQCYLNITGGICPVIDCQKSLLNGPCGGGKNGKCEVNSNIDCAWEKIYRQLKEQGRIFLDKVEIRDWGKLKFDEKKKISLSSQGKREEGFYGGVYPPEKKEETENLAIEIFPQVENVVIFLSQHTGSPSKPLVKVGDRVRIGEKIGEADGPLSSPIHASISGKVVFIEERTHPSLLKPHPAIIIKNDSSDEIDPSLKPILDWEAMPQERLIGLLKDKGIVGLGGGMFPTHIKLSSPQPIDTLLINGCECEPYLSSDNRIMIEHLPEVIKGIKIVKKIIGIENIIIGIEENKPEALTNFQKYQGDLLRVEPLKTKYPQGAERMLIKRLLNREVPQGGLPLDVGVVVLNVSTIYAIYQAIYEGLPLIQRVITICGDGLKKRGNFLIRIGTPLKEIISLCFGGKKEELFKEYHLKMGGPMMGIDQKDINSSVIKGTTAFTFLLKSAVEPSKERSCIKCGRCVEVCPMELYPLYYGYYGEKGMWEEAIGYNVEGCIECGCCEYICSSKISLISLIKKAKEYAHNKAKR